MTELNKQRITLLGSTGSIGCSSLDVIARNSDRYEVYALVANQSVEKIFQQALKHQPRYVVMIQESAAQQLQEKLAASNCDSEVLCGQAEAQRVASNSCVDTVIAAIVGAAGLEPTLAAAESGKRVLLANKEALVMAGSLFMRAVKSSGAVLLPIDSEHNAIFQCLPNTSNDASVSVSDDSLGVRKILLTASGGPFRELPLDQFGDVTPEQACAHPNWDMGRKISVDSASMMNKGLELIEACWLFDVGADKIQVVIHPQSIIHSMVEYIDGSVLAQMGEPDMRTPIAQALAWPERVESGVASLDLFTGKALEFSEPDYQRFPCLALARQVALAGCKASVVLNAANEIAVDAFLCQSLSFDKIPQLIESALTEVTDVDPGSIAEVIALDASARQFCRDWLVSQG